MGAVTGPTASAFRLRDVALTAYGPSLVSAVGYGAVTPVVALRAVELGASTGQAAFVVALMGIGQLCSSLPISALVARIGERRTLVLAGFADAVVTTAAAFAPTVWSLGLAIAASGALWTAFLQARQGFLIDLVPRSHHARAMSSLGGTMRIGIFVGPLLGAVLIGWFGIPAAFLLGAAMSLASGVLCLVLPDAGASDRGEPAPDGGTERPVTVVSVLRDYRRLLLTVGVAVVVLGASRTARMAVVPLWADAIGLHAAETSVVFGIAAAVDMLLFYPGGLMMDRFGRAVTATCVSGAIATGVLLLPLTHSLGSLAAVAIVMAIGNGLGSGIVMTLGADFAPSVGRAQFLGAWRFCGDVGGTAGPLAVAIAAAVVPLGAACVVVGVLGWLGTGWVAVWTRSADRQRRDPGVGLSLRR